MEHNILWFRIAVISTFYKNPDIQKKIFGKFGKQGLLKYKDCNRFRSCTDMFKTT